MDKVWLQEALDLARCGVGCTRPNPPVGAVVVKGGRVVGRGFHAKAGTAHAEILALAEAGRAARGGTLYVTLEPCSTQGRTGPCTTAIRAAGIRRVVACIADPNPAHRGRGLRVLRRAGIKTDCGGMEDQARELLAPFAKWVTTGRPFVTLKLGVSLDGRLADRTGRSRWITSPASRQRVQQLRREADAILIGGRTARVDDPALTFRIKPSHPVARVIMDSAGTLPLTAQVLNDRHVARTIVATTGRCRSGRLQAYARKGAQVWTFPATKSGRVPVRAVLARLGRAGYLHVVCEGGGELAASLFAGGLVDRVLWFVAPLLLGSAGRPAVGGPGWPLAAAPELEFSRVERLGRDLLLTARLAHA